MQCVHIILWQKQILMVQGHLGVSLRLQMNVEKIDNVIHMQKRYK